MKKSKCACASDSSIMTVFLPSHSCGQLVEVRCLASDSLQRVKKKEEE